MTFTNPVRLASGWFNTLIKLHSQGEQVVMNMNGGLSPLNGWIVLASLSKSKLEWPEVYEDEVISIYRWNDPAAVHYYLNSSRGRLFDPVKFDSAAEARKAALVFVPASRIEIANRPPKSHLISRGD